MKEQAENLENISARGRGMIIGAIFGATWGSSSFGEPGFDIARVSRRAFIGIGTGGLLGGLAGAVLDNMGYVRSIQRDPSRI